MTTKILGRGIKLCYIYYHEESLIRHSSGVKINTRKVYQYVTFFLLLFLQWFTGCFVCQVTYLMSYDSV